MVDILGYRRKFGVLAPAYNTVLAADVAQAYVTGLTVHASDVDQPSVPVDPVAGYLQTGRVSTAAVASAARRMAMREPHSVGLLLEEAFLDRETMTQALATVAGLLPSVVDPLEALDAALHAIGRRDSIGLLVPHAAADGDAAQRVLASIGCRAARVKALQVASPAASAHLTFVALREAVIELARDDVDVIVQLGHNVPLGRLVNNLEEDLARPVLAINQVCVWRMLRRNGIEDIIPGLSRLFLDH